MIRVRTRTWARHLSLKIKGSTHPPIPVGTRILPHRLGVQGLRLTTHLHLVPRLRISAAVTPFFFNPSCCVQGTLYLVNFMLFVTCTVDDQFTIINQENAQCSFLGIYTVSTFVKYVRCPGDIEREDLISLKYTTILQRTVYAFLLHSVTLCIKC